MSWQCYILSVAPLCGLVTRHAEAYFTGGVDRAGHVPNFLYQLWLNMTNTQRYIITSSSQVGHYMITSSLQVDII